MEEEEERSNYRVNGGEERVMEWEIGLPEDDLIPLSQPLIPPNLASAFRISPEPHRTVLEVNRASRNTLSTLRQKNPSNFNLKALPSFTENPNQDNVFVEESEEVGSSAKDRAEFRKGRRMETLEEFDSELQITENSIDDSSARALKRPRLIWNSQLHKRFIDVVSHLGVKNSVPKTIMQMMNVEGLTRENVASHLQKYRLYLKRTQGLSDEGPSSSDQLFSSTPVPHNLQEPRGQVPIPMPYGAPLMPMPVLGMAPMPINNPAMAYHGFGSHPYSMFREQQRDWSGNSFVSHPYNMPFPHVTASDK